MSYLHYLDYVNYHVVIALCLFFTLSTWISITLWKYYPVNCWFCNQNSRVCFTNKNSWFCQHCHQYNGFTSDGDYNKPLYQNMQPCNKIMYNYNKFPLRPATNGLCHKCNTNQQLKVIQLANFKPLNENKFDREVEQFNLHLEEVFKLCKNCKRQLHNKLQSEKGAFLIPKKYLPKSSNSKPQYVNVIKHFITRISFVLTFVFLIVSFMFICMNANLFFSKKIIQVLKQHKNNIINSFNTMFIQHSLNIVKEYKEAILNIRVIDNIIHFLSEYISYSGLVNYLTMEELQMISLDVSMQVLITLGLVFQAVLFLLEFGKSFSIFFNVIAWIISLYLKWTSDKYLFIFQPLLACLVLWNSSIFVNKSNTNHLNGGKVWKNMKNLSNSSVNSQYSNDDDVMSEDSDFDDSTESRNKTSSPKNIFNNQRYQFSDTKSQICRPYGFDVDNICNQSAISCDSVRGQQQSVASCTTELDRGIGTLSLDNHSNWSNQRPHTLLSPDYYNIQAPSSIYSSPSLTSCRPIISPSRFVYSTQQSWVAGGYWGAESPKKVQSSHDTSRSSSQSSGFESIVSGHHKKNGFVPVYRDYFKNLSSNKPNDICDTSLHSELSLSSNVFRNLSKTSSPVNSPLNKFILNSTLNKESPSKFQSVNLLKNPSFISPNLSNSFIPVDKPK